MDMQSDPPLSEADAIDAFAATLVSYFKSSEADGVAITGTAVDAELNNIKSGLAGLQTNGPLAIQSACVSFWTTVISAPVSFFAGYAAPAVLSPTLATIDSLLRVAGADIIATEKDITTASQSLADAIHAGHTSTPSTITLPAVPSVVAIT